MSLGDLLRSLSDRCDVCDPEGVREISATELASNLTGVLRDAEAGERYVVTVDGLAVAEFGPRHSRQWVPADAVASMLATPTDEGVLDDVAAQPIDAGLDVSAAFSDDPA